MHLPALHMSHIIAADAPLTSPISDSLPVPWDRDPALAALYDPFSLPLSGSPPSMMPGAMPSVLKAEGTESTPSPICDFRRSTMAATQPTYVLVSVHSMATTQCGNSLTLR